MKLLIKNIIFLILNYIHIVYKLKKLSVKNISIYKFKNWHFGYCYFIGYQDKKKIFIKIDTKVGVLENELITYNLLENDSNIRMVEVVQFVQYRKIQIVLFEFLEGRELSEEDILENSEYIGIIFNMLKTLSSNNIIHRDIKLDNFLLVDKELYIIDFCFAYHIEVNKNNVLKELPFTKLNCLWLKNLGIGLSPKEYHWNDFYAFSSILNRLMINSETETTILEYKNIFTNEIKKNSYKIDCLQNNFNEN